PSAAVRLAARFNAQVGLRRGLTQGAPAGVPGPPAIFRASHRSPARSLRGRARQGRRGTAPRARGGTGAGRGARLLDRPTCTSTWDLSPPVRALGAGNRGHDAGHLTREDVNESTHGAGQTGYYGPDTTGSSGYRVFD